MNINIKMSQMIIFTEYSFRFTLNTCARFWKVISYHPLTKFFFLPVIKKAVNKTVKYLIAQFSQW